MITPHVRLHKFFAKLVQITQEDMQSDECAQIHTDTTYTNKNTHRDTHTHTRTKHTIHAHIHTHRHTLDIHTLTLTHYAYHCRLFACNLSDCQLCYHSTLGCINFDTRGI